MENLVKSNIGKKNDFLDKKLRLYLLPLKELEVAWDAIAMRYLSKSTTNEVCEKTCKCDELLNVNRYRTELKDRENKHDKLIEALDKRIAEKIDSCNKILDEIENNALLKASLDKNNERCSSRTRNTYSNRN